MLARRVKQSCVPSADLPQQASFGPHRNGAAMARANPARSPYAATRHLLRNLHDARELRRNPLVGDEFHGRSHSEALQAIADRVDAALRAMENARHVALLVRVDAERHDPRRVAGDSALSNRQFYRERRLAHQAFHGAYLAAGRKKATVESDFAATLVVRASGLADCGETQSATAILEDVLASGPESGIACDGLLRLATAHAWDHRFDRARVYLDDCRELLSRENIGDVRSNALHDHYVAVTLNLRMFAEGPGSVGLGRNGARVPEGDRTTLVRAAAALRHGESAHASDLLGDLLQRQRTVTAPDFEIDLLTLQAEFANVVFSNPSLGEDLFGRAAALANATGLRGRELYARHQLAVARWMHSRQAADRRAYRQLFDALDRSLPPRLRSNLALVAADVEAAVGLPQRGLAAADAAASLSTNRFELASAQALGAAALQRMGRVGDAAAKAMLASGAARAEGHARVVSLAQRICAQVYFTQGNRRAARTAIEESIECARRFSSPYVQAQAQAIRRRISART